MLMAKFLPFLDLNASNPSKYNPVFSWINWTNRLVRLCFSIQVDFLKNSCILCWLENLNSFHYRHYEGNACSFSREDFQRINVKLAVLFEFIMCKTIIIVFYIFRMSSTSSPSSSFRGSLPKSTKPEVPLKPVIKPTQHATQIEEKSAQPKETGELANIKKQKCYDNQIIEAKQE